MTVSKAQAEVLVTGATGLIGRWLLAALTARGRNVVAIVRGAEKRAPELRTFVASIGGDASRLLVVQGDVESPSLGLEGELADVRDVYHLAARFEFGLGAAEARRANVDGTLHALEWARAQPALRRFVFLGGYRMTKRTGDLDEAGRRRLYRDYGGYEASKYEAALMFRDFVRANDLPWTAVHPSGVIGDSRTGATTQVVGLGETVERLWEGRLPALIGTARTFVPVVPVDYLASFLATVPEREETRGQDLTVLDPRTPKLSEMIRDVAAHLHVPAPRRVLPVGVVRALPEALTGVEKETLEFLSEDHYDTDSADAHAHAVGLARPDVHRSLERWTDYLVSTRFGADPSADEGALRDGVFTVGDPRLAEVVYLHGIPWNGDAWKPVADLSPARSARFDLPGHGRSAPRDHEWLDRALAGRSRPVILVGHSLGAGLAVHYAHAHPTQVRSVVLVSPAFLQRPASWTMRLSPIVAAVLRRSKPEKLARRILPESPEVVPAVRSAAFDLRRRGVASRVARALADASRPEVRASRQRELAELRCPVTIVHGESDPLIVAHRVRSVHSIAGAGHSPHVTHASAVAAIVDATHRLQSDQINYQRQ